MCMYSSCRCSPFHLSLVLSGCKLQGIVVVMLKLVASRGWGSLRLSLVRVSHSCSTVLHKSTFGWLGRSASWMFGARDWLREWGFRGWGVGGGEGEGGRGLLRRPRWLWGERHAGDTDQSLHLLQSVSLSPDVWQGPHAHTVWQRYL